MRRHEGDVEKLPKWAQSKIRVLEMRLDEAREKLAEGPADSVVWAEPYSETPRPLGDTTIAFQIAGGQIRCRVQRGVLDVLAVGRSGGTLIHPMASNHFEVRLDD